MTKCWYTRLLGQSDGITEHHDQPLYHITPTIHFFSDCFFTLYHFNIEKQNDSCKNIHYRTLKKQNDKDADACILYYLSIWVHFVRDKDARLYNVST